MNAYIKLWAMFTNAFQTGWGWHTTDKTDNQNVRGLDHACGSPVAIFSYFGHAWTANEVD